MTSIQLGGQKEDDVFYMPINSASKININMASIPTPRPVPREPKKVRPPLSSLGSMSSTTTSPPSTPSSPDKLNMRQLKLSDEDSAVGSWHEGSSHHSNDSDVVVGSPRNGVKESEVEIPFPCRVALYRRDNIHVAVKIACGTDTAGNDSRVLALLTELTDLAVQHFRQQDCDKLTLTTPQVCKLRLKDGRLAQEQLSELGRTLGQSLTVASAVCRRTPDHGYVGIFVDDIIDHKPFLTISSQGVMLVLHKINRYAPVEEFSDQVCEHITKKKPVELGDPENIWKLLQKKVKFGHAHLPKDQLLAQTFLFDPTLTIIEAAKKCFVEIRDFSLLN